MRDRDISFTRKARDEKADLAELWTRLGFSWIEGKIEALEEGIVEGGERKVGETHPSWWNTSVAPERGAQETSAGELRWGEEEIQLGAHRLPLDDTVGVQLSRSTSKGQATILTRLMDSPPPNQHWIHLELRPHRGPRLRFRARVEASDVEGLPRLASQGVEITRESLLEIVAWARQAEAKILKGVTSEQVEAGMLHLQPGKRWRLVRYLWCALICGCVVLTFAVPLLERNPYQRMLSKFIIAFFFLTSLGGMTFQGLRRRKELWSTVLSILGVIPAMVALSGLFIIPLWFFAMGLELLPILAGVVAWLPWGLRYGVGLWTSGYGELGREGFWFKPLWAERIEGRWDGDEVEVAKLVSARGWELLDDADTLRDEALRRFEAAHSQYSLGADS